MGIAKLINEYGDIYSPYMNGLINHLPMGQLALYKLTGDLDRVEDYTKSFLEKAKIDRVKEEYEKVDTIEECLGKRELYESCLDKIRERAQEENIEDLISYVLNHYTLGLSSGIFHTVIRLAYAVEGYQIDKNLQSEVERALAYYITGYREGDLFRRKISKDDSIKEMEGLIKDKGLQKSRLSGKSLGKKLKAFYENEDYKEKAFVIEGTEEEKVKALLCILLPALNNSGDIIVLHCITGLQALVTLKEYFADYNKALDALTSMIITHLLTRDDLDINVYENLGTSKTWEEIISSGTKSKDVHTIKLTYTNQKLYGLFQIAELKDATLKRIQKTN